MKQNEDEKIIWKLGERKTGGNVKFVLWIYRQTRKHTMLIKYYLKMIKILNEQTEQVMIVLKY